MKTRQMLDVTRLDRTKPSPSLFDSLDPNGAPLERLQDLRIVVPANSLRELLGSGVRVRVEINYWPGDREIGLDLRRAWQSRGFPWLDNVISSPAKLDLQRNPNWELCKDRVD